jgi:MoxR-like ATPase
LVSQLRQCVTEEETFALREAVRSVAVSDDVAGYIMDIVEATRNHKHIRIGVSTRGALALYKAAQAAAALSGRDYVTPQDVKLLAPCVLAHRMTVASSVHHGEDQALIMDILENVKVPLED